MRTRLLALGAAVVALVPVAWCGLRTDPAARSAAPAVSTATAPVTRGSVTQRVLVAGTIGYDGEYPVVDQLPPGIVTALAGPGTTVTRGGTLFAVSGIAAVLLYGAGPAYRDLGPGMSDGADVRQLEENLVALGFARFTVDSHFAGDTVDAVRRWQQARGLPPGQRTGTVPLGQVVFLPGAVRIARVEKPAGTSVTPGTEILRGTSATQVVTVALTTDRQHLLRVGNQVRVTLPAASSGTPTVAGTVTRVGRVASAVDGAGTAAGGQATVPVTIAIELPPGTGDLDRTPVQVAITTAQRDGVLMVPVTALLAKVGGGYQVRVMSPGQAQLVDVEPGLYDDTAGTVEVSGDGLAEGLAVEVPAP